MNFTAAVLARSAVRAIALLTIFGTLIGNATSSQAVGPQDADDDMFMATTAAVPSGWEFRVTPYVWIPGVSGDVTVSGFGYRALAVDYSEGSGANANSIDLVLHGPVAGLSFR